MLKPSKNLLKLSSLVAITSSIIACSGEPFDSRPLDPTGEVTPAPVTPPPVTPPPVTPPSVTPPPVTPPPAPSAEIDADLLATITADVININGGCAICHSPGGLLAAAAATGFVFDGAGQQDEAGVEIATINYVAAAAQNLALLRDVPALRNGATHSGGRFIVEGSSTDELWLEFIDQVSAVVNSGSSKPSASFTVNCESDIAGCIDDMSRAGGGAVVLAAKAYELTTTIDLVSGVDIIGQGPETIITFSDEVKGLIDRPLMYGNSVNDVTLKSFALECGASKVSSDRDLHSGYAGILLDGESHQNTGETVSNNDIEIEAVAARYCSNGLQLEDVNGLTLVDMNLRSNGSAGANLSLSKVSGVMISGGTYSDGGHGVSISQSQDVYIENADVFENADHGLLFTGGAHNVRVHNVNALANCAGGSNSCNDIQCYSNDTVCDVDLDAPKE